MGRFFILYHRQPSSSDRPAMSRPLITLQDRGPNFLDKITFPGPLKRFQALRHKRLKILIHIHMYQKIVILARNETKIVVLLHFYGKKMF